MQLTMSSRRMHGLLDRDEDEDEDKDKDKDANLGVQIT